MLDQGAILESDSNKKPVVAVTMATSRQGIGVVNELCKSNKYQIRAIKRNTRSAKAVKLANLNNVEVLKGDLMDPSSLKKLLKV